MRCLGILPTSEQLKGCIVSVTTHDLARRKKFQGTLEYFISELSAKMTEIYRKGTISTLPTNSG